MSQSASSLGLSGIGKPRLSSPSLRPLMSPTRGPKRPSQDASASSGQAGAAEPLRYTPTATPALPPVTPETHGAGARGGGGGGGSGPALAKGTGGGGGGRGSGAAGKGKGKGPAESAFAHGADGLACAQQLAEDASDEFFFGMYRSAFDNPDPLLPVIRSQYEVAVLSHTHFDPKSALATRQEHCTISARGITFVTFEKGADGVVVPARELISTAAFAREKAFHDQLRQKRTFQQFLLRRSFAGWARLTKRAKYDASREELERSLRFGPQVSKVVAECYDAMELLSARHRGAGGGVCHVADGHSHTLATLEAHLEAWASRLNVELARVRDRMMRRVAKLCKLPRKASTLPGRAGKERRPSQEELFKVVRLLHILMCESLRSLCQANLSELKQHICDPDVPHPLLLVHLEAVDVDEVEEHELEVELETMAIAQLSAHVVPDAPSFLACLARFYDELIGAEASLTANWDQVLEQNLPDTSFDPTVSCSLPDTQLAKLLQAVDFVSYVSTAVNEFYALSRSMPLMLEVNRLMTRTDEMTAKIKNAAAVADQPGGLLIDSFKEITRSQTKHITDLKCTGGQSIRSGAFFVQADALCIGILLPQAVHYFAQMSGIVSVISKREVNDLISELRRVKLELAQKPDSVQRLHTFSGELDKASRSDDAACFYCIFVLWFACCGLSGFGAPQPLCGLSRVWLAARWRLFCRPVTMRSSGMTRRSASTAGMTSCSRAR